jgi:hypothetical protein
MEARIKLQTERPVKYRPSQACFNREASEARVELARPALLLLKGRDKPNGDHRVVDVAAPAQLGASLFNQLNTRE